MNATSMRITAATTALLIGVSACSTAPKSTTKPAAKAAGSVTTAPFGKTLDGTPVNLYTLRNTKGSEAKITEYGGIVVSLTMPDRAGKMGDVVLGYSTLDGYLTNNPYFGCLVGRYGNRIGKGTFKLGTETYQLATNNGPNHLHGGIKGFDKVVWNAKPAQTPDGPALELSYVSKDGEEGFPGTLSVKAVYTLTDKNELKVEFTATTDKTTICNLTHHSYFNLACGGDILKHEVTIPANKYVPVDPTLIPVGKFAPVKGTPFDFNKSTAIGARIDNKDEQLGFGKGYDHSWVIRKRAGLGLMARVYEPSSGRVMEVLSTDPGLQFYTGNFLDGSIIGKGGSYKFRTGFCMEPQHYPDSPNQPKFPSVVLRPGQVYKNTIIYRFATR